MERSRLHLSPTLPSLTTRLVAIVAASGVTLALFPACGSDSSGGGSCASVAGTYAGTDDCSGGQQEADNNVVTQTGCTVSIKDLSDGSVTSGTVNGSVVTVNVDQGGIKGTCSITLTGESYTRSCSGSSSDGTKYSCSGSGQRTSKPEGTGGTGPGGGAGGQGVGPGAGGQGVGPGAGGQGVGPGAGGSPAGGGGCGVVWTDVADCETCMETSCCTEMSACGDGTPCGALLDCIFAQCPSFDPTCVQQSCSAEYAAGQAAASTLANCNQDSCGGCG